MNFFKKKCYIGNALTILTIITSIIIAKSHEAKDFDDTILYKIDFEMPDFDKQLNLKGEIKTFYTHDKEKYDCLIPNVEEVKKESKSTDQELSPLALLKPVMNTHSYRIEPYWSYEVLHGHHVRQYHEEREGKNIKYQEYFLGKWLPEKTELLQEEWKENRKAGIKYKTVKIDNVKYPYFEMAYTDGTMCDLIKAPRTTLVRYVCYPHGKNEIYSFKETSSCQYEVIILTSSLCVLNAFHAEESKEISIKCFNSPETTTGTTIKPHKPLSMLKQELQDMQISEEDIPIPKEVTFLAGLNDRSIVLNKVGADVDKFILNVVAATAGADHQIDVHETPSDSLSLPKQPLTIASSTNAAFTLSDTDLTFILDFLSGKNCLKGGSGWWKYEFCYGQYVRQFHHDKKTETEVFLGYFFPQLHREWLKNNPHRRYKAKSSSIWHHYEKGSKCDHNGLPRSIDVKLTCNSAYATSPNYVSMYLLEPRTCQYILGIESPMICVLLNYIDENGLIQEDRLKELKSVSKTAPNTQTTKDNHLNNENPTEWRSSTGSRSSIDSTSSTESTPNNNGDTSSNSDTQDKVEL